MKWRWLLGCQAIAFGLLGSWLYTPTRTWWNHLDNAVFTTLDSTLAEFAPGWQVFWAIGNNRVMDLVMAVVFAGLFLHFVFSGKRNRILPGLAIGCFIALHAFIVLELSREVTFERLSPTLVEASAIRLSETVAWAQPKDASENSFPSDHAIALFIIASMIWFYAGRRYGVLALVLAVACAMPRVFAGAHWATDLLVGSVFVVLLFKSLLLATPLHLLIERVLAISITRVLDLLTRARVAISYYRIQSRQRFLGADQPVGTDPDPL